jgi:hypothetical protein
MYSARSVDGDDEARKRLRAALEKQARDHEEVDEFAALRRSEVDLERERRRRDPLAAVRAIDRAQGIGDVRDGHADDDGAEAKVGTAQERDAFLREAAEARAREAEAARAEISAEAAREREWFSEAMSEFNVEKFMSRAKKPAAFNAGSVLKKLRKEGRGDQRSAKDMRDLTRRLRSYRKDKGPIKDPKTGRTPGL